MLGSLMVAYWTSDREVNGLTPNQSTARLQPWASCSYTCAFVTKQAKSSV